MTEPTGKESCPSFPTDSTTSSASGVNYPCAKGDVPKKKGQKLEQELEPHGSCSNILSTSSTTSTSMPPVFFDTECRQPKPDRERPPNLGYEVNIAKSIMKQYSSLSGDNLFDHLADIIKRVIDERPPNVIDFFEEFSRNVREQKFHLPERFPPDAVFSENRLYLMAKKILQSMNLPYNKEFDDKFSGGAEDMSLEDKSILAPLSIDTSNDRLFITFLERIQELQFYWNQCGFSMCPDDIYQLANSMDRLQTHSSILQCRFWGLIHGIKAPYYVIEVTLSSEEIDARLLKMQTEMQQTPYDNINEPMTSHIGPELTPGINGWSTYPAEELSEMLPAAEPIPLVPTVEVFDVLPEPIGKGLNRFSYFVANTLADDWIELPIVTPKQIIVSRHIKKFLTGDLDADVHSYPCFPGKEKHYLRAMIARITAGSFIAPNGYYRRMTKRELRLYEGIEDDEMDDENEEEEESDMGEDEGEEEEVAADNDVLLLRNEKYEARDLSFLNSLDNWVHVRPNILEQGRVKWYDADMERKEDEEMDEEIDDEEGEEEEEYYGEYDKEEEAKIKPEIGPPILSRVSSDTTDTLTVPWVVRRNCKYTNEKERIALLRSNLWPGAFSFAFKKISDCIYVGWGHKYLAHNIPFYHLNQTLVEYPHGIVDFIEVTDPSVADEEAHRLWYLKQQLQDQLLEEGAQDLTDFDEGQQIESGSEAE